MGFRGFGLLGSGFVSRVQGFLTGLYSGVNGILGSWRLFIGILHLGHFQVVTGIGALYKVYIPYRSLIEALYTLNSPPVVSFN